MSEPLVGIDEDLHLANSLVTKLQHQVIASYEAGDIRNALTLEDELQVAVHQRDALHETKLYLVDKERTQDCGGELSSFLYLSEAAPSLQPEEISQLVFHANAKNELLGVTGVLYVLKGWFASYVEGPEPVVDRLLRRIQKDPRHLRFRLVSRTASVPNTPRRFPNHGLKLVYLDTPQTAVQQHPEATMLCELSSHLKLQAFVPLLDKTTRGRKRDGVAENAPVVLERIVARIRPVTAAFHKCVPNPVDRVAVVERVMALLRHHTEAVNNSTTQGAITEPHACDGVTVVFYSEAHGEALQRLCDFFEDVRRSDETAPYCPVIAMHVSEAPNAPASSDPQKLISVMDGKVSVVGRPLRVVRKLSEFAMQHLQPIVVSEALADTLQRCGIAAFMTTELEVKRPMDIFVASAWVTFSYADHIAALEKRFAPAAHRLVGRTAGISQPVDADDERAAASVQHHSSVSPHRYRPTKKPAVPVTTDDANAKPVRGLPSQEELLALFMSLGGHAVAAPAGEKDAGQQLVMVRGDFDAWLHSQENAGAPVYNAEMDRMFSQFAATANSEEFISFDQFCLVAYQRLRG